MTGLTVSNSLCSRFIALQLEFLTNRVLIPQGLSLTLKDLALGRARRTAGQGIPFFVGAWWALLCGLLASISGGCSDCIHAALQAFGSYAVCEAAWQQVQTVQQLMGRLTQFLFLMFRLAPAQCRPQNVPLPVACLQSCQHCVCYSMGLVAAHATHAVLCCTCSHRGG